MYSYICKIYMFCVISLCVVFLNVGNVAHQLQVGSVYMPEDSICSQSSDLTSSDESFCLQFKSQCTEANVKISIPHHLITNLAYRLKPHHKRNQFLRVRLDTCADLAIRAVSFYHV